MFGRRPQLSMIGRPPYPFRSSVEGASLTERPFLAKWWRGELSRPPDEARDGAEDFACPAPPCLMPGGCKSAHRMRMSHLVRSTTVFNLLRMSAASMKASLASSLDRSRARSDESRRSIKTSRTLCMSATPVCRCMSRMVSIERSRRRLISW